MIRWSIIVLLVLLINTESPSKVRFVEFRLSKILKRLSKIPPLPLKIIGFLLRLEKTVFRRFWYRCGLINAYPMQSHNRWYIYTSFMPYASFITTRREHYCFIYGDVQASISCTRHIVIEFKAHNPKELQWRTVQFCIITWLMWTGCFYVHVITFKEIKMDRG